MASLDRNQQTTCSYCGKMVKELNLSLHKKSCASGAKSCPQCPKFAARLKPEMDHLTATKHAITSMIAKEKAIFMKKSIPASLHCKGTKNRYMVQRQEYRMLM